MIKRKGMSQLCKDLGISLTDKVILVVAYRMGAKKMVYSFKSLNTKIFIGLIYKIRMD